MDKDEAERELGDWKDRANRVIKERDRLGRDLQRAIERGFAAGVVAGQERTRADKAERELADWRAHAEKRAADVVRLTAKLAEANKRIGALQEEVETEQVRCDDLLAEARKGRDEALHVPTLRVALHSLKLGEQVGSILIVEELIAHAAAQGEEVK